jgi:hypothetical protein
MGLFVRSSTKLGPVRLTLSKSGRASRSTSARACATARGACTYSYLEGSSGRSRARPMLLTSSAITVTR